MSASAVSIGFDRTLRLEWLDLAAALAIEEVPLSVARERVLEGLRSEIDGHEAREKTALVLTRIWYPNTDAKRRLRDAAVELVQEISPDQRLAIHWGLTLVAYPFFRDIAAIVGRLSRLQMALSTEQIRRRLLEEYGDRSVIERARRRVVGTFAAWGVLSVIDERRGVYRLNDSLPVTQLGTQRWLLEASLRAAPAGTLPLESATHAPELFPFGFTDDTVQIVRDPRFNIATLADQRPLLSLAS